MSAVATAASTAARRRASGDQTFVGAASDKGRKASFAVVIPAAVKAGNGMLLHGALNAYAGIVTNTFDGGTDAATISAVNSDGQSGSAFDSVVIGTSGTATYSAANLFRGQMAATLAQGATSAATYLPWSTQLGVSSTGSLYGVATLKAHALPSAAVTVLQVVDSASTVQASWRISATGAIEQRSGTGTLLNTSTNTITAGSYFRLEVAILVFSATVGQLQCKLFLSPTATTPTETLTSAATVDTLRGGGANKVRAGIVSAIASWTMSIDRVSWGTAGYLGDLAGWGADPAGWIPVDSILDGGLRSKLWKRSAAGGDAGTTVTVTPDTTVDGVLELAAWQGMAADPVLAYATATEGATDVGDHVAPTVSQQTVGAWRVDIVADRSPGSTGTTVLSGPGVVRVAAYATGVAAAIGGGGAAEPLGTAGGGVWSADADNRDAVTWTVLLAPASAPARPNLGKIVMGMYNNCTLPSGAAEPNVTSANWKTIRDAYMDPGLVLVRRSFNSGLPASISASGSQGAASDAANGIVSFFSCKANIAAFTGGTTLDATVSSLAASMPAGSYLTSYHEPENDAGMAGGVFITYFQKFYTLAKAANPNIFVGPVHMAYQWRAASTTTMNPDEWWVGANYCDFVGIDSYVAANENCTSLELQADHMRWHNYMAAKGKPLLIAELGYETDSTSTANPGLHPDSARAPALAATLDWIKSTGKYVMVLYWNGWHQVKDWLITPTFSSPAGHPSVLDVWNSKVSAYGSTSADIRDTL